MQPKEITKKAFGTTFIVVGIVIHIPSFSTKFLSLDLVTVILHLKVDKVFKKL